MCQKLGCVLVLIVVTPGESATLYGCWKLSTLNPSCRIIESI